MDATSLHELPPLTESTKACHKLLDYLEKRHRDGRIRDRARAQAGDPRAVAAAVQPGEIFQADAHVTGSLCMGFWTW
jgi:hypothetical protein